MQGVQFGVLQNYFTDGTPMGLLNMRDGRCVYNPSSESQVRPGILQASQRYTNIVTNPPPLPITTLFLCDAHTEKLLRICALTLIFSNSSKLGTNL